MIPELHSEANHLRILKELRGTGRTTRIIQNLLEHTVAVQRDKPAEERHGIFIVNHPQQWGYIAILAQSMPGYIRADSRKRILYFDHAAIHFTDRFNCDPFLRGLRWPIALDHTMWESEHPLPEILYTMQDRIINFN